MGARRDEAEPWRGAQGHDRYFRSVQLAALPEATPRAGSPRGRRARWREAALLVMELAVLAGLGLLVSGRLSGLMQRRPAAQPTQSALAGVIAAPAPTIEPTRAILPGAPEPPAQSLLPPALAGLARAAIPWSPPPTPGPGAARRIVIASLGVDAPVVEGDDWEALKQGVGHRPGTADPGQVGNMVVSAHNDVFGELFRNLLDMAPGDAVLIYTDAGAYRYIVNRVELVAPTQVEVMQPTDYPALTMVSCYPYLLDTQRVVVSADLAE